MSPTHVALNKAIQAFARKSVTCEEVVDLAYRTEPRVFEEHSAELGRSYCESYVRNCFRRDEETDDQLLPGFSFPRRISVPSRDGKTIHVPQDLATWEVLLVGRGLRAENVVNAVNKQRAYDRSMDRLRPFMENHPNRTVAQAVAIMTRRDTPPDYPPAFA